MMNILTRINGQNSQACRLAVLLGSVFFFSSCGGLEKGYTPSSIIIPSHIKSIAVQAIKNETAQPGIGNKLWIAITDEFIRDGRITYSDNVNEADGIVQGTITQYRELELSHDENLIPLEYELWVIMDLKFLDKSNNQFLWHEPLLEQKLRYFVETEPGGLSIEEAREQLWERFANDIVRRTIEGFGTVTSSSPRAVPKQQRPPNPPPQYPGTAPF